MIDKKPAELSDEALVKTEKNMKILLTIFICILVLLYGAAIFVTINKGFSPTAVSPVALTVVLVVLIKNRKELKSEIQKRGLA